MTPFQAQQIRDLRVRGAGYKVIATMTGLSRDIVRNYCKRHGLHGLGDEVTANLKERIASGLACRCCGRELIQPRTGRKRKFCSDECKRAWWAAHAEKSQHRPSALYTFACAYCGAEFQAYGNRHRKYCSHDCYIRDRFWRAEDGREPYVSPKLRQEVTNEHNAMENSAAQ